MAENYKIGATDLATVLTHITQVGGGIAVPAMRQNDYTVPGRTGAVPSAPWFGPRTVTIGGIVTGTTRAAYQTNLRALMKLVHNNGLPFTLTRTLDSAPTTTTANARYAGGLEDVNQLSNRIGRVAFDLVLLDGFWYDSAYTTGTAVTGTATINVAGDAPTQDINVTWSIGPGTQRLTNSAFPGLGRLTLLPGNNTVVLTGGGTATISYKAAWL
jgi:hypothetical protein